VRDPAADDYTKQLAMDSDVLITKQSFELYVETETRDGQVEINTFIAIASRDEFNNDKAKKDPNLVHWREFTDAEGKSSYDDVFDWDNGGLQMAAYDLKEFKYAKQPNNADYQGMQVSKVSLMKRAEHVRPAFEMFDALLRKMDPRDRLTKTYDSFKILLGRFLDEKVIHDFVTKRAKDQQAKEEIEAIQTFLDTAGQTITTENIDEFEMIAGLILSNKVAGYLEDDTYRQSLYTLCATSPCKWSLYLADETVNDLLGRMNEQLRLLGCTRIQDAVIRLQRNQYITEARKLLDFTRAKELEGFLKRMHGDDYSFQQHFQGWPGLWKDIQEKVALYESCKRHLATVEAELKLTQEDCRKQEVDMALLLKRHELLKQELADVQAMAGGAAPAPAGAAAASVVVAPAPAGAAAASAVVAPASAGAAAASVMVAPASVVVAPASAGAAPASAMVAPALAGAAPASPLEKPSDEEDEDEEEEEDEIKDRSVGRKVLASKAGFPKPVDKIPRLSSPLEIPDSQPVEAPGRAMSPRVEKFLRLMPSIRFTKDGSPIPGSGPKSLPASKLGSPAPEEPRRKSARPGKDRAIFSPTNYGKRGGGLIPEPK
jgi:hypothetical protein